MINLRDQASYDSGKVPFKKKNYMLIILKKVEKYKIGNAENRKNGICNEK